MSFFFPKKNIKLKKLYIFNAMMLKVSNLFCGFEKFEDCNYVFSPH